MKLLVISDLHYGEEHKNIMKKIFNAHKVLEDLEKLLTNLLKNENKDELLIVFLGDQIFRKNKDLDLKHINDFKKTLNKYDLNYILLFGNHELYHFTKQEICDQYNLENTYFEKICNGTQLLFLDVIEQIFKENTSNDYIISINQEQINWLNEKLNEKYDNTIIFSHAPLNYFDISKTPWFQGYKDKINIKEHDVVLNLMKKINKKLLCVNGHVHAFKEINNNDIKYICVDSFSRILDETKNKPTNPQYLEININDNIINYTYKELK